MIRITGTSLAGLLLAVPLLAGPKDGATKTAGTDIDRVTISTAREGQSRPTAAPYMVAIRVKVENLGTAELMVSPDLFFLKQPTGQVRRCLTVSEATELLIAKASPLAGEINEVLSGPIRGQSATNRNMERAKGHLIETSFSFGMIPPGSFKEGLVYFEGTGQKMGKTFDAAVSAPKLFAGEIPIVW